MTDISKLSDGINTYEIKDATARTALSNKQDALVSGTNIKTINNESILGEGNITISSGPEYTAGTGIDITNNTISVDNTIATISSLATVATSGSYNDLSNKPTIPTVDQTYNGTSTNAQSGIAIQSAIDTAISSTYKAAGSIAFASLPALSSANEGKVYNITDAFTTTSDFIEGSGKSYPAGTNVVIINTSGSTYKYDVLAGFVDLSSYQQTNTAVTHTVSTAVGSTTQPVYIASNGIATATTYELNKTVPADAVFTDTTYSVFTGTDGSSAGSTGLVPAPTTTDVDKYLKGDGTWGTVSGLKNTATGSNSLTILGTATTRSNAINIGAGSAATNDGALAIGNTSQASGDSSTAIGTSAKATESGAIAVGEAAKADNNGTIAIGATAVADGIQSYQIGLGTNSTDTTLCVGWGTNANYTLLDGTTGKIPNDRLAVMTGSDGTNAGSTGLVPAPTATDNDKYLKGDGTWAEVNSSVSYDNSTINENSSNQLQTVGIIDKNSGNTLGFWHGTEQQWEHGGAVKKLYYGWGRSSFTNIAQNINTANNKNSLIYANEKFMYIGSSGYSLRYSTDNGQTWIDASLPYSGSFSTIAYGNNIYVLSIGWSYYTSSDLINWSNENNFTNYGNAIIFANNLFISLNIGGGTGNNKYNYSSNGTNWSSGTFPDSIDISVFKFVNNKFIALGGNKIFISEDGINWTNGTLPENVTWNGIAYGKGKYVISQNQGKAYYSTDLSTWTQGIVYGTGSMTSSTGNNVFFINNQFIAFNSMLADGTTPSNDFVSVSDDGINWTNYSASGNFGCICVKDNTAYMITDNKLGSDNDKFISYSGNITYLTEEQNPTSSSTVYDFFGDPTTLTITDTGSGYIQLNNTSYYDIGNVPINYTVGESYPNYICFIDGIGIKIGTVMIANNLAVTVDQTYNASSTNAQSGVAVASGISNTLGTVETLLSQV